MKTLKFVPALAAVLVLAACNSKPAVEVQPAQGNVAQATAEANQQLNNVANAANGTGAVKVEKTTDGSKTVVYRCQSGKRVSAVYAFQGEEAKAVNLVLTQGKKSQKLPTLTRDAANADFVSFASDSYVWNLDNGFTLSAATEKAGGMLTQKGMESDKILAKLCEVNTKQTAKVNK